MGTPQAVQKQIDKANLIQAELTGDNNKTEVLPEAMDDPTEVAEIKEPEPVPEKPELTGNELVDDLKSRLETSESRFKAYKKMYDKDVHESRTKVKNFEAEIAALKAEITELKESGPGKEIDDADSEKLKAIKSEFGEDFVSAVEALTQSKDTQIENLEKLLANQSKASDTPIEESAPQQRGNSEEFFSSLNTHFPNWQEVNDSNGFKKWLGTQDSNGELRQEGLKRAQDAGDAVRVSTYFWDYQAITPHRNTGGDYLPNTNVGGGDSVESGRVITGQFIEQFYSDKLKGKYSSDEAKAIEAEINEAVRKGLVI